MKRRVYLAFRHHPVVVTGLAVVAAIAFVTLGGQALGWARWELFALRIDRASAQRPLASTRIVGWSFAFRDRAVTLRVSVNVNDLEAARKVDTSAMFRATGSLRANYMMRVVRAQSRSAFIGSLVEQLRSVRRDRHLDDDEYLELLARAVQSLRYDTVGRRVRLPVEVAISGHGVCSERAILLAALMVHEGYETGMWVFDSQNHVALAVRSDAAQFRGSGYSFIETTRIAYVGEYDSDYLAAGPRSRPPQFIALGGRRQYLSGREVEYILRELRAAEQQVDSLRGLPLLAAASLGHRHDRYAVPVIQEAAARWLVSYIRGQRDDRKAVFERLVQTAVRVSGPPALLY